MKLAERRWAPARLSIHTRCVLDSDGEVHVDRTVDCPRRLNPLAVEDCIACPRSRGEVERDDGRSYVRCIEATPRDARERLGLHTKIAEVMTKSVLCIRDDVPADATLVLLQLHALDAIPVVDELGRPLGIVSHDELRGADGNAQASSLMVAVLSLPPHTPVAHAASSMVSEKVHRAVVVAADRRVIGFVTAHDLLRFVAMEAGFMVDEG